MLALAKGHMLLELLWSQLMLVGSPSHWLTAVSGL